MPQLPFYVLIILENIDKNSDLSRFENQTNGYFYDLLIRSALMKVEVKASDIDTMYMYLSCLAFKMLSENKNYFSYSEWQSFHIEYMRLFDLEISQEKFDTYYRRLLESNIIKQPSPDNFQFSYSYVYYYFCAQYLADNIEEESVRTMIVHMIGNSYIEKNADIIIFLVHLSKNKFILDEVVKQADAIYQTTDELTMEDDIVAINSLIATVPTLVVKSATTVENRRNYNRLQDEAEDVSKGMHGGKVICETRSLSSIMTS